MSLKVFTVDNLTLGSLYDSEADYNVAWNLDATVAPLLKELGQKECIKLYNTHKCFARPYSIFYIPSKVFSVKWMAGKGSVSLYDIEQYFPDLEEPETIEEIEQLGLQLLEALEIMGITPSKLTSPIAMWEETIMNELDLPTGWDMPKEAAEMAYRCSGKLWIECYKIGFWE